MNNFIWSEFYKELILKQRGGLRSRTSLRWRRFYVLLLKSTAFCSPVCGDYSHLKVKSEKGTFLLCCYIFATLRLTVTSCTCVKQKWNQTLTKHFCVRRFSVFMPLSRLGPCDHVWEKNLQEIKLLMQVFTFAGGSGLLASENSKFPQFWCEHTERKRLAFSSASQPNDADKCHAIIVSP